MKKDYSEYKPTKNEIYNLNRSDRENVRLKYFYNYARFSKDDKRIHITVDEGNEYFSMNHLIEEYTGEEITAKNFANDTELPEYIERNKKQRDVFASRFQIDFEGAEYREQQYLWDKDKGFPELPFNNVLSGARINLQYGEGILDFIYADFKSAIQEQLKLVEIENLLYKFAQQEGVKKEKSPIHKDEPEKIYSQLQERVEEYYEYSETIISIKDIIYASLYSAICPPIFKKGGDKKKQTLWYGNYLLRLQQEYREMIEFCFDEDYYPEALANRLPSERFYIYRSLKGLSPFLERTEEVAFSNTMSGKEMPYGMDIEGLKERFSQSSVPNDAHKELAEKFGTTPEKVVALINLPHFISRQYVFGSVAEILEMEFTKIHRRLFEGVFNHAGQIRQYNISKKEWILNGETVIYADFNSIRDTLDYDFATEKQFSYEGLSVEASVKHLAKFASDIWQIHPFGEGNTRATAVFMIKYMKTFGFRVNNDAFRENSWYFRNALVRANYNDLQKGIHSTTKFLELFFSNLLLGTNYELKNRYMHVDFVNENAFQSAKSEAPKCQIDTLECTLEELAVLDLIKKNPSVKQTELAEQTGKSVRSIKRIIDSLKEKQYIRRVDGKRYGKWEVLI